MCSFAVCLSRSALSQTTHASVPCHTREGMERGPESKCFFQGLYPLLFPVQGSGRGSPLTPLAPSLQTPRILFLFLPPRKTTLTKHKPREFWNEL